MNKVSFLVSDCVIKSDILLSDSETALPKFLNKVSFLVSDCVIKSDIFLSASEINFFKSFKRDSVLSFDLSIKLVSKVSEISIFFIIFSNSEFNLSLILLYSELFNFLLFDKILDILSNKFLILFPVFL